MKPEEAHSQRAKKRTFRVDLGVSVVSSSIAKSLFAPIERTKLLITNQYADPNIRCGTHPPYTGLFNCMARVCREQGIVSLWYGNYANSLRYAGTQAMNFTLYNQMKESFNQYDTVRTFSDNYSTQLLFGGVAGALATVVLHPIDYCRTLLARDYGNTPGKYRNFIDCLIKTGTGPKGVIGLYHGFATALPPSIIYRGIFFGVHDSAVEMNLYRITTPPSFRLLSKLFLAQSTAILADYASRPFDTVRRRLEIESEQPMERRYYRNALDCYKKIFQQEGLISFFKGSTPLSTRNMAAALTLMFYSELVVMI